VPWPAALSVSPTPNTNNCTVSPGMCTVSGSSVCSSLVVFVSVFKLYAVFLIGFSTTHGLLLCYKESSACGWNDVAIWIYLFDIFLHSVTVDHSSYAHDVLT